jgi:phosphoglycolate phosphatase-like HAD superfamily hydrolase
MLLSPSRADCIIFGIDGVLVDGSAAELSAAAACLSLCWDEKLKLGKGLPPDLTPYLIPAADCRTLNSAGDVVWALLALAAASGKDDLAEALPSPAAWERILKTASEPSGGEFFSARAVMDRNAVNSLYWQVYTSPAKFNAEGVKVSGGAAALEKRLFSRHWNQLPMRVGIFTARPKNGLEAALTTLQWEDFPMEQVVFEQKTPDGIDSLCRSSGCSWPLCIGGSTAESRLMEKYGKGDFIVIGAVKSADTPHFPSAADALRAILGVV